MTKKDLIIITVCINSVIFGVLFITALKRKELPQKEPIHSEIQNNKETISHSVGETKRHGNIAAIQKEKKLERFKEDNKGKEEQPPMPGTNTGSQSAPLNIDPKVDIPALSNKEKNNQDQFDQKVTDKKYYIAKVGDNPWTIAQKNNMQLEDLLKLNELNHEKAKKLRPGDRLKIQ